MKKILIFKEKYGDRYFDASTPEARDAACFKILSERFNDSWYDWMDEDMEEVDDGDKILTEEQIDALPTQVLRLSEAKRREKHLRAVRIWQENKDIYAKIKDCVENKNISAAYKILLCQSDGEYECLELENLEEP